MTILVPERCLSQNSCFPTAFRLINMKNRSITVHGAEVTITTRHEQDYISLTDMVKRFRDESVLYGGCGTATP
jgi:hypothetical protein